MVSMHFEPLRRGQPLYKGHNSCIHIVLCSEVFDNSLIPKHGDMTWE